MSYIKIIQKTGQTPLIIINKVHDFFKNYIFIF